MPIHCALSPVSSLLRAQSSSMAPPAKGDALLPWAAEQGAYPGLYFGNGSRTALAKGPGSIHFWRDANVTMRQQGCGGFSVEDVARTWMEAISPLSPADAAGMCVAAVAIAAGESYDVPGCAKKFHPTITNSVGASGLWQIKTGFSFDPKEQARTVYQKYTSNDAGYGCLSKWCTQRPGCSEPHQGIGQVQSIMQHHRFCQGMWTGPNGHYQNRLQEVGGMQKVQQACESTGLGYRESGAAGGVPQIPAPGPARKPKPAKKKKAKNPNGCASLVANVPTGWCVKNCRLGNCPESMCKCKKMPVPKRVHEAVRRLVKKVPRAPNKKRVFATGPSE